MRHKMLCRRLVSDFMVWLLWAICIHLVQFTSVAHVWLFETPWIAARHATLLTTNSQGLLKLMSIELVMPSCNSSSVIPFSSHLQSFPASGSFPMSQFFTSGGVSASAWVLPVNIQDWFPLGLMSFISSLCKGLSRIFANTTVQICSPALTSIFDYQKNHSFD